MSLDLGWKDCNEAARKAPDSDKYNMGMLLLLVGVNALATDKQMDEVHYRVRFYEKLFGPMGHAKGDGRNVPLPLATLQHWRGLRSNVSDETRAGWTKRMVKNATRDVLRYCATEKDGLEPKEVL